MTSITQAILLSAGFGTRLRPLTDTVPKCLVSIDGKPLLQIWLEQLTTAGVERILVNSHYLSQQVNAFIATSHFKDKITVFHEPDLLGTLGTLKASADFWQDGNILVAHADNLCICNWPKFINTFNNRADDIYGTMMVFDSDNPQSCGIIEYDEQQRVIAFHEKVDHPPSNLANAAIYLFSPEVKTIINKLDVKNGDISLDLIPKLLGHLNFWRTDGYLRDIGTLASLAKANQDMKALV